MTETSPTTLSPVNKKQPGKEFRRRFYTGCVVALAIFFAGLVSWPFGADSFRTSCNLDVRLNPDFLTKNPKASSNLEESLRKEIATTLDSKSLAACIRRCAAPGNESIASMRVPQLRNSLDVRIIRPADPRADWRRIQIALIGSGDNFERMVVNQILQDLAGRLSRKANWNILDQQFRGQQNLVAQNSQNMQSAALAVLRKAEQQCDHYQDQLDSLSTDLAKFNPGLSAEKLKEFQNQLDDVQRQVAEADLHLVKGIKERLVNQYGDDETNPLNQHLTTLVDQKTEELASWQKSNQTMRLAGTGTVQRNPYAFASHRKKVNHENQVELDSIRGNFQRINMAEAYRLLKKLRETIESPQIKQASFSIAKVAESQVSQFAVMKIQPGRMAFPANGNPASAWLYTLGFASIAFGSVFTLAWKPEVFGQQLSTPSQLASYLGLQHLGSIKTDGPKPGLLENSFRYVGVTIFRVCEFVMLAVLCCLIVAIVWDNQLPSLLFSNPLEFFFRAVWVLFGK